MTSDQARMLDRRTERAPATVGLRLDEVVVDSADPCVLATFWSEALGYELVECDDDVASIEDPTGGSPSLYFQRVPEAKSAKNRVHFDLSVGGEDMEVAIARLVSLGATRIDRGDDDVRWWAVLADPEGNEFCVAT
jgi:predicted enzyme related to lactoylglutathione lyase